MYLSEASEEVLEALWVAREEKNSDLLRLVDLRVMPDHAVLTELLNAKILERSGEDHVRITETGVQHARDAIRRHRLAERLLSDVLSIKETSLHYTACQFEHHLHKGIDENVCTLLGHPRFCPHGQPIPAGRCCIEHKNRVAPVVSTLAETEVGKDCHVAYLHTSDTKRSQMLISMGVIPGAQMTLLTKYPSYLFQLGNSQFAVDKSIAEEIYVRQA